MQCKSGCPTQSHTHRNIGVFHHFRKLVKADFAIPVLIRLHDGLVDNLIGR